MTVDVTGSVYVTSLGKPGTDTAIYRNTAGTWSQIAGARSRLASAPSSSLYVVTANGNLYQTPIASTAYVACPGRVSRVVPIPSGGLVALGAPMDPVNGAPIYGFTSAGDCSTGSFSVLPGAGVDVSSASSQIAILGASGGIYVTASTRTPSPNTTYTPTPAPTPTITATQTPSPMPSPSYTPGYSGYSPIAASWYGINGFTATSPPNYIAPLGPINDSGGAGSFGPPITFTAIGQTVHVDITQDNARYNGIGTIIPYLPEYQCTKNPAAVLKFTNQVYGKNAGSVDVQLTASTQNDPNCGFGFSAAVFPAPVYGNYLGAGMFIEIVGP